MGRQTGGCSVYRWMSGHICGTPSLKHLWSFSLSSFSSAPSCAFLFSVQFGGLWFWSAGAPLGQSVLQTKRRAAPASPQDRPSLVALGHSCRRLCGETGSSSVLVEYYPSAFSCQDFPISVATRSLRATDLLRRRFWCVNVPSAVSEHESRHRLLAWVPLL